MDQFPGHVIVRTRSQVEAAQRVSSGRIEPSRYEYQFGFEFFYYRKQKVLANIYILCVSYFGCFITEKAEVSVKRDVYVVIFPFILTNVTEVRTRVARVKALVIISV